MLAEVHVIIASLSKPSFWIKIRVKGGYKMKINKSSEKFLIVSANESSNKTEKLDLKVSGEGCTVQLLGKVAIEC